MGGWGLRSSTARLLAVLLAVVAAGWLGAGASHAAKVSLDAGPVSEPFDLPIHAAVHGLYAGEQVTVEADSIDAAGVPWTSSARFTARDSGTVDLAKAVPDAGTYRSADASGLLWSLLPPDPSTAAGFNPGQGFTVWVRVLVRGQVVAEQTLTRSLPAASQRISVAQAGFAGALYQVPGAPADRPAVVVIGGSEGGMPAWVAAAFQAAGYPALALGYFQEPGLPQCLCSIPLEYFAHAVAWLRAQPGFATRPLVLWGVSRGGEGALVLASYQPDLFDSVVAVSPGDSVNGSYGPGSAATIPAWTLGGRPLAPGPIPVSRIRVPVLLVAGGDDRIWDSSIYAANVMARLDATPGAPAHTYLFSTGAGHSVAGLPPYLPIGFRLGGTQAADALAAIDTWPRVLAFIAGAEARAEVGAKASQG